jgi:signal transduction histidine kinase
MKVKAKIFLFAVVPFLIAIAGIGIGARLQATALAKAQHAAVESAYLSSKEMELRHYVEIATSAIAPFYDASGDPARDDATQRRKALAVLQKTDFGRDGYFFAYDMHGNSLMHPREPDLVGHNAFRHSVQGPVRSLPDALNTALFRIAQEALTNIVRHSHAAHATLELRLSEHAVTLSIADNGCGFDIERVHADARRGIGLRNMRERLDALGGTQSIASQPYRTAVTAHVPLPCADNEPPLDSRTTPATHEYVR